MSDIKDEEAILTASDGSLQLNAKSAILIEMNSGKVLFEKDADVKMPPASITKIMTLLLVMEAIEAKKFDYNTEVTCSEHASSMGGSQIWLEVGEKMTVDELLRASAIGSANDATCALGELVSGSEEGFVSLMNERAKSLSMTNTEFKNSTGLDADGHLTTARDIAIMSRELLKHKDITKYTTVWMDSLRDGKTELVNTNKLVRFYDGATGLKTGTTSGAGCCLSASATRDELSLIAVVLGCDTSNNRFQDAKKLLNYGFSNYGNATVKIAQDELPELPVSKGTQSTVTLASEESVSFLVTKGKEGDIQKSFDLPESLVAPIKAGETVGTITFSLDGKTLGQIPIVASNNIKKMTYLNAVSRVLSSLFLK
ncbi:MAG: D-alanyl-D-alanine carboxypeptidase [Clostridia bacterium]|nr:D-alanyl-D-alanine carboxypeptidase [Clostridia bacterium]